MDSERPEGSVVRATASGSAKATTSEIRTLDERWLGVEVPEAAPA